MRPPTCTLAVDHRVQLTEAAKSLGQDEASCREFKMCVAEAFLSASRRSQTVRERGGLILDDELGARAFRTARDHDVPTGLPAEVSGKWPLAILPDFEERVLANRPSFIKVLVRGRPDDDRHVYTTQNDTVVRLYDLLERRGVPLVLELIVPARDREPQSHFDRVLRPELTAEWMYELSARGVSPAHWKLEGFEDAQGVAVVAPLIRPGQEGVILGKSAPLDTLLRWFRAARTSPAFTGFAVGRTIFWEPLLGHLRGAPLELTQRRLADNYLEVLHLWESAA